MGESLHSLLYRRYGVKTTYKVNPVVSAIAATVTRFLTNNPQRIGFIIINLGVNSMYISPLNDVSANKGVYLAPNGGTAALVWDEDFEMTSLEWYGIAPAGAVNVYIHEVLIQD